MHLLLNLTPQLVISTTAVRFATTGNILNGSNKDLDVPQTDEGSQNGAFRHVLWQAKIAAEFGVSTAAEAGNAHEENPFVNLAQRKFTSLSEADQTVDLLNNQIGREIGSKNEFKDMAEMANLVLEEYHENGLYVANKTRDGKYTVEKAKLSDKKYNALKDLFKNLDARGRRTPK